MWNLNLSSNNDNVNLMFITNDHVNLMCKNIIICSEVIGKFVVTSYCGSLYVCLIKLQILIECNIKITDAWYIYWKSCVTIHCQLIFSFSWDYCWGKGVHHLLVTVGTSAQVPFSTILLRCPSAQSSCLLFNIGAFTFAIVFTWFV